MEDELELPIEDWFWQLLDDCRPSLKRLESALQALEREQLEQYMVYYAIASEEVCPPWDTPDIDGLEFSEEDTEELADWVVSQGSAVWSYATGLDADMERIWQVMMQQGDHIDGNPVRVWDTHVAEESHEGWQSPKYLAHVIYEERFDVSYQEAADDLHGKYDW